jgi:hypothetical protein
VSKVVAQHAAHFNEIGNQKCKSAGGVLFVQTNSNPFKVNISDVVLAVVVVVVSVVDRAIDFFSTFQTLIALECCSFRF